MTASSTLRIATRESALALWQAQHVAEKFQKAYPNKKVELIPMTTKGDQILNTPLAKIGGKGLFIKELETALLENRADCAVHSMKDVGIDLPHDFEIVAILEREDPSDAFVSNHYQNLNELPQKAKIGTCSLRRRMQLKRHRPDLELLDLRGNLQTRLEKLDQGQFDAIILASAGLKRLNLEQRIKAQIPLNISLPAIGQGAIGIECHPENPFYPLLKKLNHEESALCVQAERIISTRLQGSCQIPLAAFAEIKAQTFHFHTRLSNFNGTHTIEFKSQSPIAQSQTLAQQAAEHLIAQGALEILKEWMTHA